MSIKHIIGAALLVAATAHAETVSEQCSPVSQLAEKIMRARQSGISLLQLMEIANGNKIAEALVQDAFKQSRFSSEPFQDRAVQDFRERVEIECVRSVKRGAK